MNNKLPIFTVVVAILLLASAADVSAQDNFQVLYNFATGVSNASDPLSGVIADGAGNLYGTTSTGGSNGGGVVYQLTPEANGWSENILVDFSNSSGARPMANVVMDSKGNLYGTTESGGSYQAGTVFELSPASDGTWTFSVLYTFTGKADGGMSTAALVLDGSGNLYGTAGAGGDFTGACRFYGCGVVFKLSPTSGGEWKETVLYRFRDRTDGTYPGGALVFDHAGNLYGTTEEGGDRAACGFEGCGVVYELSPTLNGEWKENVLYRFKRFDRGGFSPYGTVVFDVAGNLYGVAHGGELACGVGFYCGIVYELSPIGGGLYQLNVIHAFTGKEDGDDPCGDLTTDSEGNVYGTNVADGAEGGGVAYKLSPDSHGHWNLTVLHSFSQVPPQASFPNGDLLIDASGNIYGTNAYGGSGRGGYVYELTPPSQ